MNPDNDLRVKIAEADGWKRLGRNTFNGWPMYERGGVRAAVRHAIIDGCEYLPAYDTDRDAIVGAVLRKFQTTQEQTAFADALEDLDERGDVTRPFALATADALTLARAYCAAAGIGVEGGG